MAGTVAQTLTAANAATNRSGGSDEKPAAKTKPETKNVEFRSAGSTKASRTTIYGIAWSNDIFVVEKSAEDESESAPTRHFFRNLASCAGREVFVYDIEIPNPHDKRKGRPSKSGDFNLVQLYEDPDKDEQYFACAFAGRSLGRPFGFHPILIDNGAKTESNTLQKVEVTNNVAIGVGVSYSDDTKMVPVSEGETTSMEVASGRQAPENVITADHDIQMPESAGLDSASKDQITASSGNDNKSRTGNGEPPQKRTKPGTDDETNAHAMKSECPENPGKQKLIRQLLDSDSHDGPQLLCVGGLCKSIKVIDTVRRQTVMQLSGHGDEIDDLKVSPTDEWLLLSASKDKSFRLWNLKSATSVAVFAGYEGHKNGVLSVGWHCTGKRIASTGYDYRIKIWDVGPGTKVHENIQKSHAARLRKLDNNTFAAIEYFKPIICQFPTFSTNKLHLHAVDCVQFIGDIVLSKADDKIIMWVIDESEERDPNVPLPPPSQVIDLHSFEFDTNPNEVTYFFRFGTDPLGKILTLGTRTGDIVYWKIGQRSRKPCKKLKTHRKCLIRNTVWSPDGKILLACCDVGELYKWDVLDG